MTTQPQSEVRCTAGEAGRLLTEARQARGMTLSDAARELRLTRTTLEAIEDGRMDSIAPIYRRGYVRNYATLLGLDPGPLVAALGDADPEPLRAVLPLPRTGQRFDRFVRLATYALVTTMIVPPLVYFFVLGGAQLFQGELPGDFAASSTASSPESTVERIAGGNGAARAAEPAGHLSASAMPLSSIRTPVSVAPNAVETAEPAEAPAPAEPDPLTRIELELNEDSWVEITDADGERLEFDLLRAGQNRSYRGLAPFRLLLGRASAVDVRLDGTPVEFEGHARAGKAEVTLGQAAGIDGASEEPQSLTGID